jgi:TATA-box binding protein (TBP) (component of TFIID and TFIIIB)
MLKDNKDELDDLSNHSLPYKKIIINENYQFDQTKEKLFNEMIINELQLSSLYKKSEGQVHISTITLTCKINDIKFHCDNIAKYIDLSENCIVSVSKDSGHITGDDKNILIHRTVLAKEKKKKNTKAKKKKSFYNQVSMYVKIPSKVNGYVHVKLFTNGSLQIAGCKTSDDISNVITAVLKKLREVKAIVNDNKIEEKPFVSDSKYANISCITDFKISMINTNFKMKFEVNLTKLHTLLLSCGHKCIFDRIKHSCVNLSFNHPEKKISIFIFEKGSIVITGAKSGDQILAGYDFIKKFLYTNFKKINKIKINTTKFIDNNKDNKDNKVSTEKNNIKK